MIRAVLFDLDGVLTTELTGSGPLVRSLAFHTGIPEERLRPAYFRYNADLLMGRITHADMWEEFCREVGEEIDYDLLRVGFVETPLDCDMIDLVEKLHQRCKTALVTNNKVDRIEAIFDHHHLYDHFDAIAVSGEIGSGKEERAIFDWVLEELGVAPHECIFIDNTEDYLIIPRQMGMATVLFDPDRRDVQALTRLLTNDSL